MARTEKESLIQDVVGRIVLGQRGSTPEVENRLPQAAGLWHIVIRLDWWRGQIPANCGRRAKEAKNWQEQLRRKHIYVNHFRRIGCGSTFFCKHWPFAREQAVERVLTAETFGI